MKILSHSCSMIVALFCGLLLACNDAQNTMTDPRDGKTYKTIVFNDQVWMTENLNFATNESLCLSGFVCDTYGRFYNWKDAQSACPSGWRLPKKEELETVAEKLEKGDMNAKFLFPVNMGCYRGQDGVEYHKDCSAYWSSSAVDECGERSGEQDCFSVYVLGQFVQGTKVFPEGFDAEVLYSVKCVQE